MAPLNAKHYAGPKNEISNGPHWQVMAPSPVCPVAISPMNSTKGSHRLARLCALPLGIWVFLQKRVEFGNGSFQVSDDCSAVIVR
jgi:hypothetical protein